MATSFESEGPFPEMRKCGRRIVTARSTDKMVESGQLLLKPRSWTYKPVTNLSAVKISQAVQEYKPSIPMLIIRDIPNQFMQLFRAPRHFDGTRVHLEKQISCLLPRSKTLSYHDNIAVARFAHYIVNGSEVCQ